MTTTRFSQSSRRAPRRTTRRHPHRNSRASFPLRSALLALSLSLLSACGPSLDPTVATLPGSGTANLAKPSAPVKTTAPVVDPWQGKELITAPAALPPSALVMPEVLRFTLKNGLEVIAVHDSSLPVTTMQVAIKAGNRQATREKVGLAEFTAQVMTRGTKSRNASRLAQDIEYVGGSMQASASYEATVFSCKSLSKDLKTCMTLLPDVLANPSFPKGELDLIRRNLLAVVRGRLDDASQLASAHFQSALWGNDHVRGWVMSESTIDAISRTDMLAWHKTWIRPNNAVLAISGNFDAKRIKGELERKFARWRKAEVPNVAPLALPKLKGLQIRLVDKPGQTQSHIRLGQLGLAHGDKDFYATLAFNHALGGGQFSARLMKVIRSAEGKAYTASSRFDRNTEVGAFVSATFTRSAETLATVKLIQQVVRGMAEEGPTEKEMTSAKTHIAGLYAMRFGNAESIASALLAADLHDLDDSYVSQYPLNVDKVSRAQAKSAAARLLRGKNSVLVIVGDAKIVGPQLKAAGLAFELVGHTQAISNWERELRAKSQEQSSDPDKVAAAIKLLNEALSKKGGEKKLRNLKGYHWKGDAQLKSPQGAVPAIVEKQYSKPGKLRLDLEISGGVVRVATVLNGKKGWAQEQSPRGNNLRDFTAVEMNALSGQLWRDSELVLLRHLEKGAVIKFLGEEVLADKTIAAILVKSPKGDEVILLVDEKSKLLLGMDYSDQGIRTSERFADYKKAGAILVAYQRSTKSSQVDLSLKITLFETNKAIANSVFARPAKTP